jgi:hypothetical protein
MAGAAARGTARPPAASRGHLSCASAGTPAIKPDNKTHTRPGRRNNPDSKQRLNSPVLGAAPDNARRSGTRACDTLPATGELGVTLTARPWCSRARQRDTAGTAGGRSPGCRARPAAASVGPTSEGRERSGPPRNGESPRLNRSRLRRVTQAAPFPWIARAHPSLLTAWPSGLARRRCALEAVQRIVTANVCCWQCADVPAPRQPGPALCQRAPTP